MRGLVLDEKSCHPIPLEIARVTYLHRENLISKDPLRLGYQDVRVYWW